MGAGTFRIAAAALALAVPLAGNAALFEDDEARRAILELRQRVEQQRLGFEAQNQQMQQQLQQLQRATAENEQLRRSLLDLQNQIESLRKELAGLRGQDEQMLREIANVQRLQRDMATAVEDRLRKMEPNKVTVDGREFMADPAEQREFEAALANFRKGDFTAAQDGFSNFVRRWPASGYAPSALFWLGNAQYALRDYKNAMTNFRALLQQSQDHPRAPEAVLSIANCQIELKDAAGAKRTLADLMKAYPQSEAAVAARDRLARLR